MYFEDKIQVFVPDRIGCEVNPLFVIQLNFHYSFLSNEKETNSCKFCHSQSITLLILKFLLFLILKHLYSNPTSILRKGKEKMWFFEYRIPALSSQLLTIVSLARLFISLDVPQNLAQSPVYISLSKNVH